MLGLLIIMNTFSFPDQKAIAVKAATWIAKIDQGLSNESQKELSDWLDESPAHGEALVKYASMWDKFEILEPISSILPIDRYDVELSVNNNINQFQSNMVSSSSIRVCVKYACIASVFLPLVFVFWYLQQSDQTANNLTKQVISNQVNVEVYASLIGEAKDVVLSDGSQMSLNTDTEVVVEFSASQRKVVIKRGEVFFNVAKNPLRPFVVMTADTHVTAIGTAFNIEVDVTKGTEVLVTEGRVKVDHFVDFKQSSKSEIEEVFLSRGQKVHIQEQQVKVSDYVDADSALAWRNGMIIFSGETLEQVVTEIDRYTPLSFKIVDKDIASIQVGGGFRAGDIQQLLFALEQNFGVESQYIDQEIRLSKAVIK